MRTTARFHILRERILKKLFSIKNLSNIWRGVVKKQMRSLDILDLHDYYDFNLTIENRAREICDLIVRGQYLASPPLIYRLEKKHGICRNMMIPNPSDALVFQTITEHLASPMKEAAPTTKAYYSRDKHQLKLPHQFDEAKRYPWYVLWPRFQKEILKFSKACDFLVVTDVADFFDNIGLRELRHMISEKIKVEEVVLDLLFHIIEQLSWTPDYLPKSFKGLPTINLEAFRLLPHTMLFELDEVLDKETNGNFVRWMDDINFGTSTKKHAYRTLGKINDVLKSRGLGLNLAKTVVYKSDQARYHFMFEENAYLDDVARADSGNEGFVHIKTHIQQQL